MVMSWNLLFIFISWIINITYAVIQPGSVIQVEGLDVSFFCLQQNSVFTRWFVNGVRVTSLNSNFNFPPISHDSPPQIVIPAIGAYNNSVIQCSSQVIIEGGGDEEVRSENVTLQVQGAPAAPDLVFNKEQTTNSSITITWCPVFSLNLTSVEPDVLYYVEIYYNAQLISSEEQFETFFTYSPSIPNPGDVYSFRVTPVSNVPGAKNGTASLVEGYVFAEPLALNADVITYSTNSMLQPLTWQFPSGNSPGRNPTSFFIELNSIDSSSNPSQCSCPASSEVIGDYMQLTPVFCPLGCDLQRHRVYNYVITASNNAGTVVTSPALFSTHDVQQFTASQIQMTLSLTTIVASWSYLSGSESRGAFIIIHSLTNYSDTHFIAQDRGTESSSMIAINGLTNDMYNVIVFDRIGRNGMPESRPAGVLIAGVSQDDILQEGLPSPLPESSLPPPTNLLTINRDQFCVNCSFSESQVAACIVFAYEVNTETVLEKELEIHQINTTANVFNCFPLGMSLAVAVYGLLHSGLENKPIFTTIINQRIYQTTTSESNSPATDSVTLTLIAAGGGISGVLLLVLVATIIVIIRACSQRKGSPSSKVEMAERDHGPVDVLTTNDAYNVLGPSARPRVPPGPSNVGNSSPPHVYDECVIKTGKPQTVPEHGYADIDDCKLYAEIK